jgi:transcriptional regulator with XRE-family HTH domain
MNSTLVRNCLLEIKQQLKRKGIAYADIAERMELSEITVKRMLNQDDISVGRLTVLAEAAGFSMSKLIGIAEAKLPEVKCFTAHQDEAFVRHPHLFQYFMKLQEHDRSPETVARLFNLDDLSTYLYLRKLEDLGLIELHEGNRVKMPGVLMTFAPDSQFIRKGVAWSLEQATNALLGHKDETSDLSILFLPAKHCEELVQDIEKVFLRFADRYGDAYWGDLWTGDIRQLVTFSYAVKSKYPEYEIIRVKDGDLK